MRKIVTCLIIIAVALSVVVPVYGEDTEVSFSDVKPGQEWQYTNSITVIHSG